MKRSEKRRVQDRDRDGRPTLQASLGEDFDPHDDDAEAAPHTHALDDQFNEPHIRVDQAVLDLTPTTM